MKIVIFGSAGFVGHNLLENFTSPDFDIISCDLVSIPLQNVMHNFIDVTNYNSVLNKTKNADVIINLSAHPLSKSFSEIFHSVDVNIIGMINILEAARKNNVKRIIFTSASSLIGESLNTKVSENDFPNPKTPYGILKLASEQLLRIYQETYGIEYVIFRFFNIYGPYQINGLIPNIHMKLMNSSPIEVFGDGTQIRDYVFVPDVTQFFIDSIKTNSGKNKIINMGSGVGSTVLDVIKTASDILKIEPKIKFNEPRKGEISNFIADTNLLTKEFGRVPQTSLADGMKKTFEWLSKNKT